MNKIETAIPGVVIIEPDVFGDDRGFFYESFNADKFDALGVPSTFAQDNHSFSKKGVLRGLHFQLPPKAMAKLVRCTRGRLMDVAVDLRKDSPTYKQHVMIELSEENKKMLYMPAGVAHGFYALTDCELLYKCSHTYDKSGDGNVRFDDPAFNIPWPLEGEPLLSDRDKVAPAFADLDLPF